MYKFGELFPPPKLDGLQLKRNSFRTHRDYHSRMQLFYSNQYTSVCSSNMKHTNKSKDMDISVIDVVTTTVFMFEKTF